MQGRNGSNGNGNGARALSAAGFLVMPFSWEEDVERAVFERDADWWNKWSSQGLLVSHPGMVGSVVTNKGWRQLADDEQAALDEVIDWFKSKFSAVRVLGKDEEGNTHGELAFNVGDASQRRLVEKLAAKTVHAGELEPDPTRAVSDFGADVLDVQVRVLPREEAVSLRARVGVQRRGD